MAGFLAYHGVEANVSRRWRAQMVEGVLALDLREPATEIIRARREKAVAG